LNFGETVRVSDLPHSDKVKFLTDENQAVAHVTSVKEAAAPAAAEEAEAGAAPAEPEVIKKGKAEAEGEGEGDKAEKKK
jgi:large subunit ribosomal protein L25